MPAENSAPSQLDDLASILLSEEQINTRLKELGAEINAAYAGREIAVIAIIRLRHGP